MEADTQDLVFSWRVTSLAQPGPQCPLRRDDRHRRRHAPALRSRPRGRRRARDRGGARFLCRRRCVRNGARRPLHGGRSRTTSTASTRCTSSPGFSRRSRRSRSRRSTARRRAPASASRSRATCASPPTVAASAPPSRRSGSAATSAPPGSSRGGSGPQRRRSCSFWQLHRRQAVQLELVNRVFPSDAFLAEVRGIAHRIAHGPLVSFR